MSEALHRHPPEPSPRSAFYTAHADAGHAPQWTERGGVACGCGGSHPGAEPGAPEPEPEAG